MKTKLSSNINGSTKCLDEGKKLKGTVKIENNFGLLYAD